VAPAVIEAAIFLCDKTGNMAKPWAAAGYRCYCFDIQHSIRKDRVEGNIHYVWGDVRTVRRPPGIKIVFGASFTPCTNAAGSGSRDWEKKGGYMLRDGLECFEAARQVLSWCDAPYMQENSVGIFSSIPHIGKPDYYFDPCDYTGWCPDDNYTKKTCIWGGNGFKMPPPFRDETLDPPDDRIHKASGDDQAEFRSITPMGFSIATFHANRPGAVEW
jgi:hypothetical protein